MFRTALATVAVAVLALGATGCAPTPGTPTAPTATVTVTETATATVTAPPVTAVPTPPEPAASDPISALEAWAICRAQPQPDLDPAFWTPLGYSATAVAGSAASWTVTLGWNSTDSQAGALVYCTVTGTLGQPSVALKGPIDI